MGDITFELIQMLEGNAIQNEFLRTQVDDLETEIVMWKETDFKILQRSKRHTPIEEDRYAYLSTDTVGGVMFELQQRKGP